MFEWFILGFMLLGIILILTYILIVYLIPYMRKDAQEKEKKNAKCRVTVVAPAPPPLEEEDCPCPKDFNGLKTYMIKAVDTLKDHIDIIYTKDILKLEPYTLLSQHPFYTPVLQLAKYLSEQCFTRHDFMESFHSIYGYNYEHSPHLHVNLPEDPHHFLLIDIHNGLDYYKKHKKIIDFIVKL